MITFHVNCFLMDRSLNEKIFSSICESVENITLPLFYIRQIQLATELENQFSSMLMVVFYFQAKELPERVNITDAAVLLNLGDSVTTDHISPAGSISRTSAAARYLANKGYV